MDRDSILLSLFLYDKEKENKYGGKGFYACRAALPQR